MYYYLFCLNVKCSPVCQKPATVSNPATVAEPATVSNLATVAEPATVYNPATGC